MSTNTDSAAFPVMDADMTGLHCRESGMSLRQWYAGMALIGQLAFSPQDSFNKAHQPADVAEISWRMADAMLAAPDEHMRAAAPVLFSALRVLLTGIGLDDISDADLRARPCALSDRVLAARAALAKAMGVGA